MKIKASDKDDIYALVSNYEVMKFIANRKVWDSDKTDRFIKYTIQEDKSNSKEIMYRKVVEEDMGDAFVGMVGIHKYENEDDYNLTILLSPKFQGRGNGSKSLELALEEFHKLNKKAVRVIADTLTYNKPMQKVLVKRGFMFDKMVKRSGKDYKRYKYLYELHDIIQYDYPYIKYFMSEEECIARFKKLQSSKESRVEQREKGKFGFDIIVDYSMDKEFNRITDWFTDFCRVRAQFKGTVITPYEHYKKYKGTILKRAMKDNKFDYDKFEDTMYNAIRMCNNFQISIIMDIFKYFKPKNILDSSAGWGDRLIASMAYGASYTGVDPSSCLKPLYNKIIKTLKPHVDSKLKYRVLSKPFEQVSKTELEESYDLAFTSPPFYDLEVYNDDGDQSIMGFKTLKGWVEGFLNVLADINIHYIKVGGHFVIYVPEYDEFMEYMKNRDDLEYCGDVMYYYTHDNRKKRKIMVWKKIK